MTTRQFTIRTATLADATAVTDVIAASYGNLLAAHYEAVTLDRALPLMTKANSTLLNSGKYYVAETSEGDIIGCGGWSFERPGTTEVVAGTAHVRHFATEPRWIGRGVAKAILRRCIAEAEARGSNIMEAFSTLAAVDFYRALGFVPIGPLDIMLTPGVILPSMHMRLEASKVVV